MARFLIEVPHEAEVTACARAVKVFLNTGSHFLANADWGCRDGEHKAWLIADMDSKEEARSVLPQGFRSDAKITRLDKFTLQEIDEMLREHSGGAGEGDASRRMAGARSRRT
jgi:hypothetical protein